MSSVARICIKTNEGIKSIRVFFDGEPSYLGPELLKNWKTEPSVHELLSLGDVRSVENGKTELHEDNIIKPMTHMTLVDLMEADTQAYYFYIFIDDVWYFRSRNTKLFIVSEWLTSELKNRVDL